MSRVDPVARRDPDTGYLAHGRWYPDPYAWMERLDDPQTTAWVAAQEAATRRVLDAVPDRDRLRALVQRATAYPRRSRPTRSVRGGLLGAT